MSDYQPTPPQAAPYSTSQVPASERYNVLAIVAFVLAFFVSVAGIVCGHIALGQIKRTGERGHGLALAGTILGYVFTVFYILLFAAVLVFPFLALAAGGFSTSP